MNSRIKEIRKTLEMTQESFASKIDLSRNFIAQIESGTKVPSDRTIKDICRVFNVNEEWLRSGTGEMFTNLDKENQLMAWAGSVLKDESDSFKKRFVRMLMNLDESGWEALEKFALTLLPNDENKEG